MMNYKDDVQKVDIYSMGVLIKTPQGTFTSGIGWVPICDEL